jgi:hypothetical protein
VRKMHSEEWKIGKDEMGVKIGLEVGRGCWESYWG